MHTVAIHQSKSKNYVQHDTQITVSRHTSTVFSSEQTRLRSSPVPVPETADIGSGESLANQQKVSKK